MTDAKSIRNVERALDELKRGRPVRLAKMAVTAAESVTEAQCPLKLLLSEQRAGYLGLTGPVIQLNNHQFFMIEPLLFAGELEEKPTGAALSEAEKTAVELVKRAGFLPAAAELSRAEKDLHTLTIEEAKAYLALPVELALDNIVSLPLEASEESRVAVFLERGGLTHLALLIGQPEKAKTPLTRLHSSCLTGDLLGSLRCDCGSQLKSALESIAGEKHGVLLYLNQEGRGIGLANKLRAYRLQELGLDTVDANLALGFAEDERDFAIAAHMLKALGIRNIRLLTNNPGKLKSLEEAGVKIAERVPLKIAPGAHNKKYLEAKAAKLGHQY